MAKRRRKNQGPVFEDFFAAAKRKGMSKTRFRRMQQFAQIRVKRRIDEKSAEYFKLRETLSLPPEQARWIAETTLLLDDYWNHQHISKMYEAEFEFATTILEQYNTFGQLISFDPQQIGWAMRAVGTAPKYERSESAKARSAKRRSRIKQRGWDKDWKKLGIFVNKNPSLGKKLKEISLQLSARQFELKEAEQNYDKLVGVENQLKMLETITENKYKEVLKKISGPLFKRRVEYFSMLENWWIFWHNLARQSKIKFLPSFLDEIARRRHNATEEKNKAKRKIV